jgi:hypothetical protein
MRLLQQSTFEHNNLWYAHIQILIPRQESIERTTKTLEWFRVRYSNEKSHIQFLERHIKHLKDGSYPEFDPHLTLGPFLAKDQALAAIQQIESLDRGQFEAVEQINDRLSGSTFTATQLRYEAAMRRLNSEYAEIFPWLTQREANS